MSDDLFSYQNDSPEENLFEDIKPEVKEATPAPASSGNGAPPKNTPSTGIGTGGNDQLRSLIDDNFLQYAAYVIRDRAIPKLEDGLKPVQRRILWSLHENDDGKFIKVANIVGYCMQYHPHGDASIADALVVLTNKRYLIEGQGNFGNIYTGDRAAASRYIECRLTDLARNELFMDELTPFVPSYDGRNKEPVTLPCKLPLLLMLGAEGIAVGLSTSVLPHNFIELLEAQVSIIQKKPFTIYPDFLTGGFMDVAEYEKGQGKITLRARFEHKKSEKGIIRVNEIPYGTTTDSLIKSIEDAAKKGKVNVKSINDFTAEKIEIEIKLGQGEDPEKAMQALYAFTLCEVSMSSRLISIENNRPVELTVDEVLKRNTKQLLHLLNAELELRKKKLEHELHQKTLVQIFVENRIYKRIEECKSYDAVQKAVHEGFEPFADKMKRPLSKEDVEMLLGIRIRRISLFDINKHRQDMDAILEELAEIQKNLKSLNKYAIAYLRRLIKKYKDEYPRLTEIEAFEEIDVQEIAAEDMVLKYDDERGYIGYDVPGEDYVTCTNYDKVVVVMADGRYKVQPPPERLFVDKGMLYAAPIDKEKVMTVVYTVDQVTYMKRFTFGGFIMNKEYLSTAEGAKVLLFTDENPEKLFVKYKPAKGQRIHQQEFDLHKIPIKSVKARGNQVTVKKIAKISTSQPRNWDANAGPAGQTL